MYILQNYSLEIEHDKFLKMYIKIFFKINFNIFKSKTLVKFFGEKN